MPKLAVSTRSVANKQDDELKAATLTRNDVATRLGVSVSTVRRLEGSKLHPLISGDGVRRFKPSDVEQLAKSFAANQNAPRNAGPIATREPELSKGELAARVFERLEQRHSLAEIVIALRVSPDEVRGLYHTWLTGLWSGELQHAAPALPANHTEQAAIRRVTAVQLAQLLIALPEKQSTRISIARMVGEFTLPDDDAAHGFVEYRNLTELGGFTASGPITLADIIARVGAGDYRVSAYGFEPRGLRWEVVATLDVASHASRVV